jgi:hypothetical protein
MIEASANHAKRKRFCVSVSGTCSLPFHDLLGSTTVESIEYEKMNATDNSEAIAKKIIRLSPC